MKKNAAILITILLVSLSLLSACGSNTKQTEPSTSSSSNDNKTTATTVEPSKDATTEKLVEIKVMAKDFEFDKKEIHVKKGDKVKITLQSDDGGHGLAIPAYNVSINGNGSAEFTADKTGTFEYHCSIMCGAGHAEMTGKLIVE